MLFWLLWSCGGASPAPCVEGAPLPEAPRAAGCAVRTDQGLLLVRTVGGWSYPAGGIDPGESTQQAAVRETLEEAGIAVRADAVACVVASNAFVAHRCTAIDPSQVPEPDGIETFEARYVPRAELQQWPDDVFRFPAQADSYRR